jgi:hypothetical protein
VDRRRGAGESRASDGARRGQGSLGALLSGLMGFDGFHAGLVTDVGRLTSLFLKLVSMFLFITQKFL